MKKLLSQVRQLILTGGMPDQVPSATAIHMFCNTPRVIAEIEAPMFRLEIVSGQKPEVARILKGTMMPLSKLPWKSKEEFKEYANEAVKQALRQVLGGLTPNHGQVTVNLRGIHPMVQAAIVSAVCNSESRKAESDLFEAQFPHLSHRLQFVGQQRFLSVMKSRRLSLAPPLLLCQHSRN